MRKIEISARLEKSLRKS